jgi:hypothetical protein
LPPSSVEGGSVAGGVVGGVVGGGCVVAGVPQVELTVDGVDPGIAAGGSNRGRGAVDSVLPTDHDQPSTVPAGGFRVGPRVE